MSTDPDVTWPMPDVAEEDMCWAGWKAFLGGRWKLPCVHEGIHVIGAPGLEKPVRLCEKHFQEALALGLVTDPYIGDEEYQRRRNLPGLSVASINRSDGGPIV